MNKHFEKYNTLKKKKDVGRASIRNKYTYFPFYETETNSPINRYRLWVKYRESCIKNRIKYVDFKTYGKVLHQIGKNFLKILTTDPDGIRFKAFKLRTEFFKDESLKKMNVTFKPRYKKKDIFSIKMWTINQSENLRKELMRLEKEGLINDYTFTRMGNATLKKILNKLDFFDDF